MQRVYILGYTPPMVEPLDNTIHFHVKPIFLHLSCICGEWCSMLSTAPVHFCSTRARRLFRPARLSGSWHSWSPQRAAQGLTDPQANKSFFAGTLFGVVFNGKPTAPPTIFRGRSCWAAMTWWVGIGAQGGSALNCLEQLTQDAHAQRSIQVVGKRCAVHFDLLQNGIWAAESAVPCRLQSCL